MRSRLVPVYALFSAFAVRESAAYKIFQRKVPNGANVPGVEALGHEREGGGPNNDFGLDFIEAQFKWTKVFCEKDSDGDGQTNGQELGDPCCEFEHRVNEKVRWTEGVSHPGDPNLKANPAMWENLVCIASKANDKVETKPKATAAAIDEKVMDTAVQSETNKLEENQLTIGAPALHTSVMLSAGVLTVMVIYWVIRRLKRRSLRKLPIFQQRRRM